MMNEHIAIYLNDHLAGSVAALELLEKLEAANIATNLQNVFRQLREDIQADQRVLESVMARLEVKESRPRKAAAWITEKISEIKLNIDDPRQGALWLLEASEALALGIEGKKALWRSLETIAGQADELREFDFNSLLKRAEAQRSRVEVVRLDAAINGLLTASY